MNATLRITIYENNIVQSLSTRLHFKNLTSRLISYSHTIFYKE